MITKQKRKRSFADSTNGKGKTCHQKMTSSTTEKATTSTVIRKALHVNNHNSNSLKTPNNEKQATQFKRSGTSLVVQQLRLRLPVQGAQVRSLVWELRSHMPPASWPKNIKHKRHCNKFNTDFKKWSTLKKKIFKNKIKRLAFHAGPIYF